MEKKVMVSLNEKEKEKDVFVHASPIKDGRFKIS
jgi:hypothetical protein